MDNGQATRPKKSVGLAASATSPLNPGEYNRPEQSGTTDVPMAGNLVRSEGAINELEEVAKRFPDLSVDPKILLEHETELLRSGVPSDETRKLIHLRFVDQSATFTLDPLIAQRLAPVNQTIPYSGWELDKRFACRNPTDLSRFTPAERAQISYYVVSSLSCEYRNPAKLFEILGRVCFVEQDRYRRLLNHAVHRHRLSTNDKLYRGVDDFVISGGLWKDARGVLQKESIYFSKLPQGASYKHTCFLSTSLNPNISTVSNWWQFGDIVYAINAPIGLPFVHYNALPVTTDEGTLEPEFQILLLEVLLPPKLWLQKVMREGKLEVDILNPYRVPG